jgi:hypothetical protein
MWDNAICFRGISNRDSCCCEVLVMGQHAAPNLLRSMQSKCISFSRMFDTYVVGGVGGGMQRGWHEALHIVNIRLHVPVLISIRDRHERC